ncbi:hypothetical protein MUO65_03915 [bacterium]|nr:hypothetical protein [bacterium]
MVDNKRLITGIKPYTTIITTTGIKPYTTKYFNIRCLSDILVGIKC